MGSQTDKIEAIHLEILRLREVWKYGEDVVDAHTRVELNFCFELLEVEKVKAMVKIGELLACIVTELSIK